MKIIRVLFIIVTSTWIISVGFIRMVFELLDHYCKKVDRKIDKLFEVLTK